MKTIKKYFMWIILGIGSIFGIFIWLAKLSSKKKLDKIDKQIDDNNATINNAQGHIENIEEQKEDVKEVIETREQTIEELKEQKENIQPETPKTVADAKENIINKTKRRGRKPRK